ncbi:uncharacterized protein ELE39_002199 [Cryptosporidium sp. chipmunk genotype I]|uniref:uncharacterized protein n=1 Tax=Cryptosporidium sp. chipmunk genotype I TaxID=1280935 RepID=UPI00351A7260|nr:hypothetical protein ELE39_002199 [Cryptosporidium sp. chipmunk genotype I]
MKANFSGHSIINGLLSSKPENILETIQILAQIDINGTPSNILDYLRVSPLCLELLQAWSKYVVESISVKKSKKSIQNGESTERKIVVGALNCISEIIEYYIFVFRIRRVDISHLDEFKENIEKIGMLIISKYKTNIYRHLNSTSKVLISSSLRLLASISSLSKSHKQEILHEFNFTLPSFLSISKFFEYKKRGRPEFEQISIFKDNNQDIFTILYDKKSEVGVRIQYLRFLLSFLDFSYIESSKLCNSSITEKNIVQFLKIRNISNTIFKNSFQYDTLNISKGLLFVFEDTILENEEIPNTLKASFFNVTVINYIFNNLVEILSQVDLRHQLEAKNDDLERYARIIEKLLRLHINSKTKEKVRLIFVWFKSINRQVKYPIIQNLLINIYYDLTFKEKMEYFVSSTVQFNTIGESKLEGILVLGFVSSLIKIITQVEKDDIQKFIIQNILSKDSLPDFELGINYLANWIVPPFIRNVLSVGAATTSLGSGGGGIKMLNTGENLFVNISNLIILVNLSKRLSLITKFILSSSTEFQSNDRGEYIINMIKQIIYQSFPEIGNILNLLRHYFKQEGVQERDQKDVISSFFSKRDHYNSNSYDFSSIQSLGNASSIGNKECGREEQYGENQIIGVNEEEDDGIFINIIASKSPTGKEKKSKVKGQKSEDVNMGSSSLDTKEVEKENINSNMVIFHYIKAKMSSSHIISEFNEKKDIVRCKFEILEIILDALKSVLKSFGNEFLLSMGYKFDNTKLILDRVYRESYLNEEFLNSLSTLEYKRFFDNYLYQIILYSLNIKKLKYDWNCNKFLLFKFLDNLISIIIQYYQENTNQNGKESVNCITSSNISFMVKYFMGMWISIVSKLNSSRQNSVFYYLDYVRKDNNFSTLDLNLLYFQLKLLLFVNKTLYNFEILIKGFFEDYLKEGILSKDFLERNMDLVVLLLMINLPSNNNLREDSKSIIESQKYELLVSIINLKGMIGQLKSDLNLVEKNYQFKFGNVNDYIVDLIERRLRFELLEIQSHDNNTNSDTIKNSSLNFEIVAKSIQTLLTSVFNNWVHCDEVRVKILKRFEITGKIIKDEITFVKNVKYYYRLIYDTGFQSEFDISEIISNFIAISLCLKDNKEKLKRDEFIEMDNKIKIIILELNYYQMQFCSSRSGHRSEIDEYGMKIQPVSFVSGDSVRIQQFLTDLAKLIGDLNLKEGQNRSQLLVSSFLDIYIKLGLGNKLLFKLLFSNDLNLKEIITSGSYEFLTDSKENDQLIGYFIDTILDNISNYELVSITREIILKEMDKKEGILGISGRIFLSRLIQKLFQVYISTIERNDGEEGAKEEGLQEEGDVFNCCFFFAFVELIKILVDRDIFQYYKVRLYSFREERKHNIKRNNLELNIPIEIFGFKRHFRKNGGLMARVFLYIMVNFFPYVYLRTDELEMIQDEKYLNMKENHKLISHQNEINQLDQIIIESFPIGYKLILILDNSELTKFKFRVNKKELFNEEISFTIVKSATKELIELYSFYKKESYKIKKEDLDINNSKIFKKAFNSFKIFPLIVGNFEKSRMKSCIKDGNQLLKVQDENDQEFWEILDLLVFKNQERNLRLEFSYKKRDILVNSNLIFKFLIDLYSKYNNKVNVEKNNLEIISEIIYLGYLLYYENFENNKDEKKIVSILIECYNVLLLKFQNLISKSNHFFIIHYYYIILMPVLMDKLNNPIYYCLYSYLIQLRYEKGDEFGLKEKKCLNFILDFNVNESFYDLLNKVKEMKEYQNKYPIGFIESSKTFINNNKSILDYNYVNNKEFDLLSIILLSSTLYLAKIKQMRSFKFTRCIYNELSNFVLLKINRIMVFLNKIHEILFDYLNVNILNSNNSFLNNNKKRHIMVLFIFIEYLIILKEDGNNSLNMMNNNIVDEKFKELENDQRMDLLLSKEYIIDYLRITKIGKFQENSLYYKILNESRNVESRIDGFENEDYNINGKIFKSLILVNHNMFLVNSKLRETLTIEEEGINNMNDNDKNDDEMINQRKMERIRLVKHWYHYYSIYLNNYYIDFENEEISEFNWLNPNLKKLKYTLNNFPYNTKLIRNSDLDFNLNIRIRKYNDNDNNNDYYIYDLGFVIPIINSRFKLAYSILRERGFHNSKNKNINLLNENIKGFDEKILDKEEEKDEEGRDIRTCSGFVENYNQLSESRFFSKVIDNNFIWLRNFCKNGSLQLVVNSLSCTDISLRYYSYQTLSLLYEIISFHYNKYLQRMRDQEEKEKKEEDKIYQDKEHEEKENDDEDEEDEENDDVDEEDEENDKEEEKKEIKEEIETMNKRKRNKKQRKKHIRYIFKELPQVFMILNTLKNTVSGTLVSEEKEKNSDKDDDKDFESKHEDCIRLSSFLTRFISDSIEIIFEPENKLFKQINYFMLSRSFLDRYDIPLLFNLLYSEDTNDHFIYKSFIFKELETSIGILKYLRNIKGLEFNQEHDSINRRFIFPILFNYIKTNNIYSQHNYFENIKYILNIILNMMNNRESNIIYHYLENINQDLDLDLDSSSSSILDLNLDDNDVNSSFQNKYIKLINNSLIFSNPKVEILLKDLVKNTNKSKVINQENNLPSSVTLTIQMVNQYSLLDFIRNLIQQISISNYNKLNNSNKDYKEILQLLINILLVITSNMFNGNFINNYYDKILYKLKYYNNNNLNKTILKFLGGYSNSYWVFQKLLACIKLASNPKISKFYDKGVFFNIYHIWLNSYIGLLYCNKYLFKDFENPKLFNELISNYQEALSNYLFVYR